MSIAIIILLIVSTTYLLWMGMAMKVTKGGLLAMFIFKLVPVLCSWGLAAMAVMRFAQLPL